MLIEFSVKNYRSFWESQTLSMTAGSTKELHEDNTFVSPVPELARLLRSAVVYGPNGGGKSNLIKAIAFMQDLVLLSSKESQEGEHIRLKPFLLHPEGHSQSSEFEVVFIEDGTRYQYGFAATRTRIAHEWLFAYPGNKPQRWFERSYNPKKDKEDWYFGAKFTGQKKTWQQSTRPNALFLSTAVQLNSEQLKPIFNWFQRLIVIAHGERIERGFTINSCENKKECDEILQFLKSAGIQVDEIAIKEKKLDNIKFPTDMPNELRDLIQNDLQGKIVKEVLFKHQVANSEDFELFPLTEESDGTQKLFAYAAPWLDLLHNGRVLVVDELDNSFHPHLVRYLLKLIHGSKSNNANGQLIFSTHDTSILDPKVLRRDQIWFMEKDDTHATQLYPLTDFHPRKNEALEKGYLQGRYGALPYIGEIKF
jgi:AAA15 family ATPase/GTPase